MDYLKLTADELRSKDLAELRTTVGEIQKQLATVRMDVYTPSAVGVGKIKRLKKSLARVLTVTTEKSKKS